MELKFFLNFLLFTITKASIINSNDIKNSTALISNNDIPDNVFNGVYSDCFLHLSYSCLQKKTLLYLKELNNLSEVSVIGDYVMFGKYNFSFFNKKQLQVFIAMPIQADITLRNSDLT